MKKIILCLVLLLSVLCFNACVDSKTPNKPITNETMTNETMTDIPVDPQVDEGNISSELSEIEITLYFPDNDALFLHKEVRVVEVAQNESVETVILRELFRGPVNDELSPSLAGEDLVISASTDDDGVCTVDFKSDFVLLNTGGSTRENFAIASIVNSLCELDGVDKVALTVENKKDVEFGHFIIESTLEPMTELVKPE